MDLWTNTSTFFLIWKRSRCTHFVCLDADETFTSNFVPIARDIMSQLEPGRKG